LCLPILTEIDPIIDRGTGAKQFEILISFVFGTTKDDEMQNKNRNWEQKTIFLKTLSTSNSADNLKKSF
jgi:hypothetical protein